MRALLFALGLLLAAAAVSATVPPPSDIPGCVENIYYMPVECTGDIINDTFSGGCRAVVCEDGGSSMRVLACDKPTQANAQYFEMYRQQVVGPAHIEVCFGDTCLESDALQGFAKSEDYPVCFEDPIPPVCGNQVVEEGEQCDDGNAVGGDGCSATCQLERECEIDHRTQTQGGWGQGASENNPGAYRDANFAAAFPSGLTVGHPDGFVAHFTSAAAIEAYLPAGGTPGALTQNHTNATSTDAGAFGGQTVALALNIGFDQYDPNFSDSDTPLADLVVDEGICTGMTVQEVLDEANIVLAGLPSGLTASQASDCAGLINQNFVDGTTDNGDLVCPQAPSGPVCGNGVVETGEQCDDGGTVGGDGCSAACRIEDSVCAEGVETVGAACSGGTISADTLLYGGACRSVTCENGSDLLRVLACEKPSSLNPEYFELYRQEQSGAGIEICVDGTCLRNDDLRGYARGSEFCALQ